MILTKLYSELIQSIRTFPRLGDEVILLRGTIQIKIVAVKSSWERGGDEGDAQEAWLSDVKP